MTDTKKTLMSIALIACCALVIYSNTFQSSFHFDDLQSIVENYAVHRFDLGEIFRTSMRPVLDMTFALNYRFGKLDVFGYHLVNLLLHIANSVMLFFLLRRFVAAAGGSGMRIPLYASLLFVSHPVQTQAVTYIVSRSSVLATSFFLLSLLLFLRAYRGCAGSGRPLPWLVVSFVSACCGMATKQEAATLPLMVLLADYFFLANGNWRSVRQRAAGHLLIFSSLAVVLYLSFSGIQSSISIDYAQGADLQQARPVTSFQYFLTQLKVVPFYIKLLLLPVNQNLDYDWPVTRQVDLPSVFFSALIAAALFMAVRLFPRYRLVSFGIFWFFVTLSVTSSFLVIYDVIFEHRLYLPSIGFATVAAFLLSRISGSSAVGAANTVPVEET